MKGDHNEENQQSTNKVLSFLQMVRIHQHAKCQAIPRCILQEMPGNHKLDFSVMRNQETKLKDK